VIKLDKKKVHKLLDEIIAGKPPEEQAAVLKDIIVNEFCCIADELVLTDLEAEIHEAIRADPSQKIQAEAKEFVESLTPGHPNFGKRQSVGKLSDDYTHQKIAEKLDRIVKEYGKKSD
jgi:hypothetical protein